MGNKPVLIVYLESLGKLDSSMEHVWGKRFAEEKPDCLQKIIANSDSNFLLILLCVSVMSR